jgi:DNA-binding response OmpR family regulator
MSMPKKILIIDDEVDFAIAVKVNLEANGYLVASADNGKAGIETVKKWSPDLILLDLVMPEMNGFLVLSELKKDPYTATIPVIMLTAKTESEYATDAGSLGALGYVSKPIKMHELEAAIRKYL